MEAYPKDRAGNRTEWMIVAETLKDVIDLNLDGPSGLINVLKRRGYKKVRYAPKDGDQTLCYTYVKAPKPTVVLYPHQQVVHCDSADNADVGRGYNLAGLWLDELAKWGPRLGTRVSCPPYAPTYPAAGTRAVSSPPPRNRSAS